MYFCIIFNIICMDTLSDIMCNSAGYYIHKHCPISLIALSHQTHA